ncbi:hypothetical protein [Sphingobacterium sp. MYb382]|uniref:hypothetical protein n=1 Tax=Sphingobacterium sp. MYb382 TaxID=2745278 RepID=UPI00309A60ED
MKKYRYLAALSVAVLLVLSVVKPINHNDPLQIVRLFAFSASFLWFSYLVVKALKQKWSITSKKA